MTPEMRAAYEAAGIIEPAPMPTFAELAPFWEARGLRVTVATTVTLEPVDPVGITEGMGWGGTGADCHLAANTATMAYLEWVEDGKRVGGEVPQAEVEPPAEKPRRKPRVVEPKTEAAPQPAPPVAEEPVPLPPGLAAIPVVASDDAPPTTVEQWLTGAREEKAPLPGGGQWTGRPDTWVPTPYQHAPAPDGPPPPTNGATQPERAYAGAKTLAAVKDRGLLPNLERAIELERRLASGMTRPQNKDGYEAEVAAVYAVLSEMDVLRVVCSAVWDAAEREFHDPSTGEILALTEIRDRWLASLEGTDAEAVKAVDPEMAATDRAVDRVVASFA